MEKSQEEWETLGESGEKGEVREDEGKVRKTGKKWSWKRGKSGKNGEELGNEGKK